MNDRAHVVVVSGHHDEIAVPGCLARGRRGLAAVLLGPLLRLGRGAVVDGDVVAAFLKQVARHRVAHHARPRNATFAMSAPGVVEYRGAAIVPPGRQAEKAQS